MFKEQEDENEFRNFTSIFISFWFILKMNLLTLKKINHLPPNERILF